MKKRLTDIAIKNLKPGTKPYEVMDSEVKGLGVRVMGKPGAAVKTFIMVKRLPGKAHSSRYALGYYRAPGGHDGDLSLLQARELGGEWGRLIRQGLDPNAETSRRKEAEQEAKRLREENSFGHALEAYIERKASKLRSHAVIEHGLRVEFATWAARPLSSITQNDVKTIIRGVIERGAPVQAHVVFGLLRSFMNWCIDSGDFDLAASPCAQIRPAILIGERNCRNRTLTDHEISALWRAAEGLAYPYGQFIKLLLLTALRRDECAMAQWSEIDMAARLWVIPSERMKGKAGKAIAHAIPLTPASQFRPSAMPRGALTG